MNERLKVIARIPDPLQALAEACHVIGADGSVSCSALNVWKASIRSHDVGDFAVESYEARRAVRKCILAVADGGHFPAE